jgi:signal peptidase I
MVLRLARRLVFFVKLIFFNYLALGAGYEMQGHKFRFAACVTLFVLAITCSIIGFPLEYFAQAPFYLGTAFMVLMFFDAIPVTILTEPSMLKTRWDSRRFMTIAALFAVQWSFIGIHHWLYTHQLTTTRLLNPSYPNMLPLFERGDVVVSFGWAWREREIGEYGMRRGDIVVFPGEDTRVWRRIAALPGDTIEVRQGRAVINGEMWDAEHVGETAYPLYDGTLQEASLYRETMPGGKTYDIIIRNRSPQFHTVESKAFTVPPDHVGVLSDLRPVALDENSLENIIVHKDRVIARPIRIIWSRNIENINRLM